MKNCNYFHRTLLPLLNHIRVRRYLTRPTHILATHRQISTWHCASYFPSLLPSRCRYFGIKIRSILHRSSSTRIFSSSPSFDSNIFTSPYWITADGKTQTSTFRKLHWNQEPEQRSWKEDRCFRGAATRRSAQTKHGIIHKGRSSNRGLEGSRFIYSVRVCA